MKRGKRLVLRLSLLLIFCFLLPSVFSLGLSGTKLSPLTYEPGKIIINHYSITDTKLPTAVSVSGSGEINSFLSLSEMKNNEFDLVIQFPEKLTIKPGIYTFGLSVNEVPPEGIVGVGSYLSVSKRFEVLVYSYDKYLEASFEVPSVNEGNPLNFQISANSKSYSDIEEVKGYISVYDSKNQELGKLVTNEKSLKALSSEILTARFNTTGLLPGDYWAKAIVTYDGKSLTLNDSFKIGNMDLIVKNYTQEMEQGFSEFSAWVTNNWGNEIKNVYTKLFLDSQELLQTPSINLAPWQEGELKGIVNIELLPGEYSGKLQLFFEGESKNEMIKLKILPKKVNLQEEMGKTKKLAFIFMSLSLIIFFILVGYIIYEKKFRKKKKDGF